MDEINSEWDAFRETDAEEEERRRRRRERLARMRREKERRLRMQRILVIAVPAAAALLIAGVILAVLFGRSSGDRKDEAVGIRPETTADAPDFRGGETSGEELEQKGETEPDAGETQPEVSDGQETPPNAAAEPVHGPAIVHSAQTTAGTGEPPEEVNSTNVVFIELSTGDILTQRNCREVINPASMTKVLTLLVAAEHVTDLDDTFTMTVEITDYSYFNDCSSVGFDVGETVTVRDLLYGTILPSGGDAAVALAVYVAGSQEAFVDLMNEKLEELGLSGTAHFTNCVGIYNEDHHCSVYDMAMIMEAALDNELCREVLRAHTYLTSKTEQHPEGILISNWFLRRIEDKDTGGEVVCAKTGFVNQSASCAVSYGVDAAGREYVCATTGAHSAWRCIYDHVAIYKKYAQQAENAVP